MMKQKIGLLACSFLTCGVSLGATTVQRYYLDYFYITNVHLDASNEPKYFGKLSSNGSVTRKLINFYVYNSKYKTGTSVKNIRPSDETGIVSGTFTSKLFMTNEENLVKIFFTDSDKKRTEHTFSVYYDDTYPTISVDQLETASYEKANVPAYSKEAGYFMATNKYLFNNWYDINDITIYNKFDVGMFTFEEKIQDLSIPSSYYQFDLGIPAIYGLFVDQTNEEYTKNLVVLNLKFVEKENYVYQMALNQDVYVNPYTYEMARSQLPGFVQTKYIYLPKNGFSNLRRLSFKVLGEKLGTMRLNFRYDFSIQAFRSRIGNCVSSEYCIRTDDTKFSENGKELTND